MYYILSYFGIVSLLTYLTVLCRTKMYGVTFEILHRIKEIMNNSQKNIKMILITKDNKIIKDANYSSYIQNLGQIRNFIVEGTKKSIIYSEEEVNNHLNTFLLGNSFILSATIKQEDKITDITAHLYKFIHPDNIMSYGKITQILDLNNVSYNNNTVLSIMDNNAEDYEIELGKINKIICHPENIPLLEIK